LSGQESPRELQGHLVTDGLREPPLPRTLRLPVDVTPEIARKNIRLGIGLFVLALLIAAGAVVVALVYLHFDSVP
jgi:hypothetical protein